MACRRRRLQNRHQIVKLQAMKFLKQRLISVFLILLLGFPVNLNAEALPPLPQGPLLLTSVRPDQLNPDYWINKLPDPNRVLKTPEQMRVFNQDIHAMIKDCVEVFKIGSTKSGATIKEFILQQYNAVRGRGLYNMNNQPTPKAYFDTHAKPNLNLSKIPATIKIKYGVASYPVVVRSIPFGEKFMEKPDDPEFDMLQFTRLKVWDPVAVYHTSTDGKWVLIQSPYIRGWAEASGIVTFSSMETLKNKLSKFLVVLGESVEMYKDPQLTQRWMRVSMGTKLAYRGKENGVHVVSMPVKGGTFKNGYISARADVADHFLPFTQANIIRQAFKLLGARYGWAGQYYGRDCSGFIQDVYLGFGIDMPRGSKGQTFVGTQLGHLEYKSDGEARKQILDQASPAITLLRMPSHQMIYLGKENGQYYVIHCTWAERYSMTSDAKNRINQVVVSDLELNGRSHLGSLFDRIITITELN
jgi:hypothetical protein